MVLTFNISLGDEFNKKSNVYNGLEDPYLKRFFENNRMKEHLRSMGIVFI
jgi:hypothetical protein